MQNLFRDNPRLKYILGIGAVLALVIFTVSCDGNSAKNIAPKSTSGVHKATATVEVNSEGKTLEQENILKRLDNNDDPGEVKHLYVISAFSGDVILYSTVQGKVTSSGKRLSPYEGHYTRTSQTDGSINYGQKFSGDLRTYEMLQDDGTYGSSVPYIYWYDVRGVEHQHYPSGGQIIHLADAPMAWPKIILNLEES